MQDRARFPTDEPNRDAGGRLPMTMAEQNPVSYLLDGMVHCRNCGALMTATGWSPGEMPRYVCSRRQDGCDTPEVPAEPLVRLVVETVVRATLEGDNARRVVEAVRDDARQRSEDYTSARLDEAFRTMDFHDPLSIAPHPSEYMPEPDPETRRLLELDPAEYIEPLAPGQPILGRHGRHRAHRGVRLRSGHLPAANQHPNHQGHYRNCRARDPGRPRIRYHRIPDRHAATEWHRREVPGSGGPAQLATNSLQIPDLSLFDVFGREGENRLRYFGPFDPHHPAERPSLPPAHWNRIPPGTGSPSRWRPAVPTGVALPPATASTGVRLTSPARWCRPVTDARRQPPRTPGTALPTRWSSLRSAPRKPLG